jgi:hypothetical protein
MVTESGLGPAEHEEGTERQSHKKKGMLTLLTRIDLAFLAFFGKVAGWIA